MNVAILIALLCLSAFFSISEISTMSIDKITLRKLVQEQPRRSRPLVKLLGETGSLLNTILFANNLANVFISSLVTSISLSLGFTNLGAITIGVTILIVLFGEVIPKTLGKANSEKVSLAVSPVMTVICWIFTPVNLVLNAITGFLVRLTGGTLETDGVISQDNLLDMVELAHVDGSIDSEEKDMVTQALVLDLKVVKDFVIPFSEVTAVPKEADSEVIRETFEACKHSRLPVLDSQSSSYVGVIHVKDFVMNKGKVRELITVKENLALDDCLKLMQQKRISVVEVKEQGLVFLNDILEELVGELDDEFDFH